VSQLTLKELSAEAYRISVSKGWHEKPKTFAEYTALFHSEISEAFEEFRAGHRPQEIYFENDVFGHRPEALKAAETLAGQGNKPEGIGIELADELIRIFDYAGAEELDLDALVRIKAAYNETRARRHGGKVI